MLAEPCGNSARVSPLRDKTVILVGAHDAEHGARRVLAASRIEQVPAAEIRAHSTLPLGKALERLKLHGVTRLYLHLDVDVLDAAETPANEFAAEGGLSRDQLACCVGLVIEKFEVTAAAVAS